MASHREAGTLLSVIPTSLKGHPSVEQACFVQTDRDASSLCLNKQANGCGEIGMVCLERLKSTSDSGDFSFLRYPRIIWHALAVPSSFRCLFQRSQTVREVKCFLSTHGLFCSACFAELGDRLSFLGLGRGKCSTTCSLPAVILVGMFRDWDSQGLLPAHILWMQLDGV